METWALGGFSRLGCVCEGALAKNTEASHLLPAGWHPQGTAGDSTPTKPQNWPGGHLSTRAGHGPGPAHHGHQHCLCTTPLTAAARPAGEPFIPSARVTSRVRTKTGRQLATPQSHASERLGRVTLAFQLLKWEGA